MEQLTLLGSSHTDYGQSARGALNGACAWLHVGLDPNSPGRFNKGQPNEDALLLAHHEGRMLLAVADGHFGNAGCELIAHLAQAVSARFPSRVSDLSFLLMQGFDTADGRSGSSLTVALVDGPSVLGLCFGDSWIVSAGPAGSLLRCLPNDHFLHGHQPAPLDRVQPFQFRLEPGEGLLLCSDGVHECCYRQPELSLSLPHLQAAFEACAGSAEVWGDTVVQSALRGVGGNPGGQDNIALISWIPAL